MWPSGDLRIGDADVQVSGPVTGTARNESASTAYPWFSAQIATFLVARSWLGWLPPWWPNLSFFVFPPRASARI
jgi:hypothetical protein